MERLSRRQGWAIIGAALFVFALALALVLLGASTETAYGVVMLLAKIVVPLVCLWGYWRWRKKHRPEKEKQ